MLLIVDGTGPFSDGDYQQAMSGSFCWQLHHQFGHGSLYFRGPSLDGTRTLQKATIVAHLIDRIAPKEPIYLAGYSRGGAAVIAAAGKVKREIAGMFLFDAVDRALFLDADSVSANVAAVYHVIRDPKFAETSEPAVSQATWQLVKQLTHFRPTFDIPTFIAAAKLADAEADDLKLKYLRCRYDMFGNTGTSAQKSGAYHQTKVPGTHGAMGGLPWADVKGDRDAAMRVARWMSDRINEALKGSTRVSLKLLHRA